MTEEQTVDGDGMSRRRLIRNAAAAGVGAAVWASPSAASLVGTPAYAQACSLRDQINDLFLDGGHYSFPHTASNGVTVNLVVDVGTFITTEILHITWPDGYRQCSTDSGEIDIAGVIRLLGFNNVGEAIVPMANYTNGATCYTPGILGIPSVLLPMCDLTDATTPDIEMNELHCCS